MFLYVNISQDNNQDISQSEKDEEVPFFKTQELIPNKVQLSYKLNNLIAHYGFMFLVFVCCNILCDTAQHFRI